MKIKRIITLFFGLFSFFTLVVLFKGERIYAKNDITPSKYFNVYKEGIYNEGLLTLKLFNNENDEYRLPLNITYSQQVEQLESNTKTILTKRPEYAVVVNGEIHFLKNKSNFELPLNKTGKYRVELRKVVSNSKNLKINEKIRPIESFVFSLTVENPLKNLLENKTFYYEQYSSVVGAGNSIQRAIENNFPVSFFPEVENITNILLNTTENKIATNYNIVKDFNINTTPNEIEGVNTTLSLKSNFKDSSGNFETININFKSLLNLEEQNNNRSKLDYLNNLESGERLPIFIDVFDNKNDFIYGKNLQTDNIEITNFLLKGIIKTNDGSELGPFNFEKNLNGSFKMNVNLIGNEIQNIFLEKEVIENNLKSENYFSQGLLKIEIKLPVYSVFVEEKMFPKNEFIFYRELVYYNSKNVKQGDVVIDVEEAENLKFGKQELFLGSSLTADKKNSIFTLRQNLSISRKDIEDLYTEKIYQHLDIYTNFLYLGKNYKNYHQNYEYIIFSLESIYNKSKSLEKKLIVEVGYKEGNSTKTKKESLSYSIEDLVPPLIISEYKNIIYITREEFKNFNIKNYVLIFDDITPKENLVISYERKEVENKIEYEIKAFDEAGNKSKKNIEIKLVDDEEREGLFYRYGLFLRKIFGGE